MNVNELIEELDGYGGHLPAKVALEATGNVGTLQKRDDDTLLDFEVDVRIVDGESVLLITPVPA
jgi:hypothetical protein